MHNKLKQSLSQTRGFKDQTYLLNCLESSTAAGLSCIGSIDAIPFLTQRHISDFPTQTRIESLLQVGP